MTFEVEIYSTRRKDHESKNILKDSKSKKKFFLGRNPFRAIAAAVEDKEMLGKSEKEVLDYLNTMIYEGEYEDDAQVITQQDLLRFRSEALRYEEDEASSGDYDSIKIPYKRLPGSPVNQPATGRTANNNNNEQKSKSSRTEKKELEIEKIVRKPSKLPEQQPKTQSSRDVSVRDATLERKKSKKSKKDEQLRFPTIKGFDGFMMY